MGNKSIDKKHKNGFTIVELLVVIVVIGILAIITFVGFPGVVKDSIDSSVKSDLDTVSKHLKVFQTSTIANGKYPTRIDDCPTPAAGNLCIKSNGTNKLSYTPDNNASPKNFRTTSYNEDYGFYYSNNADDIKCPLNFVIVPGSSLYGTKDFCVMKYEAKKTGSNSSEPISTPTGTHNTVVTQSQAVTYSKNVSNCSDCHLISEAEWMTIAQNVLGVASNWSGNAVGVGYIYSGHNDYTPLRALDAGVDTDGYKDTGNFSGDVSITNGMVGNTQRRTLTLSNGEVTWDLAGDIQEWTSGQTNGTQPGVNGNAYNTWIDWKNVTTPGTLSINPSAANTLIPGANSWSSTNGIGILMSNTSDVSLRSFLRSGTWGSTTSAGVLSLYLYTTTNMASTGIGFRVAR